MRVFVSSAVRGFETERDAACAAATALEHDVKRCEDFAAADTTPQRACLQGVRWADVVVLLLGPRYGAPQQSGISATHEEYREARDGSAVIVFVQDGIEFEADQRLFADEVEDWGGGRLVERFTTPESLRDGVTRALHRHELAGATGPVDEADMAARAAALAKPDDRMGWTTISLAIAAGPRQTILRPGEIEAASLSREIQREAMFGEVAVLGADSATETGLRGGVLTLAQDRAAIALDPTGAIRIVQPAQKQRDRRGGMDVSMAIIEEFIAERISIALRFSDWLLDRVDPSGRLTHIAPAVGLNAPHMGWRTKEEDRRQPHSITLPTHAAQEVITLTPAVLRREALKATAADLTVDLVTLLRRGRRA